jgi:hypothetical protein
LHTENELPRPIPSGRNVCVVGGWWVVGGWFQGEFSVSFGPKSKFCSSDLDLDQAEQYKLEEKNIYTPTQPIGS